MVGDILFADSFEYLEDQVDPLNVDSHESLLKHFLRHGSGALQSQSKRNRELIDVLPGIGHEASCEAVLLRINKGFKSKMKTFLSNTAISASDSFEKIAGSLNLSQRSVY